MAHDNVDSRLYKLSPAFGGRPLPPSRVKRLRWLGVWAPTAVGAILLLITLTSFQALTPMLLILLVLGMSTAGAALFTWYWFAFAYILSGHEGMVCDGTDRAALSPAGSSPPIPTELILSATTEGIYGVDLQGNITFVNPAAARTIGCDPEALIGQPAHAVLRHSKADGAPYPEEECPVCVALGDGGMRRAADEMFWRRDGISFPVEYTATPIRENGSVVGGLVVFHDVTESKRAEESLCWLEKAVHTMQLGVTITDVNGEILYTNHAEANMHGYLVDDLIGKDVRIFAPDKLWNPMAFDQVKSIHTWKRQSVNVRKDGSVFPVQLMSDVVTNAGGDPVAVVTSCEDITERKRVEEELRTRAHQLEQLYTIGVALTSVLDSHAVLRTIAEEARALMQAKLVIVAIPEEPYLRVAALAGDDQGFAKHLQISLDPASPRGRGPTAKAFTHKTPVAVGDMLEDPSCGPWRDAASRAGIRSMVVVPLLYREEVRGFLMVFSDVPRAADEGKIQLLTTMASQAVIATENARLYEELWHAARQLEARVEERTKALHAANLQLDEARLQAEKASSHKSEFLANMSHELRTPLNAILGFSELLADERFGSLNEKQRRYVTHVHASGLHLLNLINDLLDLSKVEAGKIEIHREELLLKEALEEALNLVNCEAAKKGLAITLAVDEDLPTLSADPVRFRQIVNNLLSNAVKFTPEGGIVSVSATVRPPASENRPLEKSRDGGPWPSDAGPLLEITVQDTGIGIAPQDLPKLFQPFTQLEPILSKGHPGTGLGLALSKRLVELHGGRIWAESGGQGQGSTFTFQLPLNGNPSHSRC